MTVIVFRDGVMAADTMAGDGQSRWRVQKLARLQDGGVAGFCGETSAGAAALNWLASGGSLEGHEDRKFQPDIAGAWVLIAKGDDTLWLLDGRFPAYQILDKWTAIGCGGPAARVALGLGLSAVDAAKQVALHDINCSDPVQSMEVEPTHEYGQAVTHKPKRR